MARRKQNIDKRAELKEKDSRIKKTGRFSKRNVEDRDAEYNSYSKRNDPSWYAQNEQLLRDVASFSYNYPVGGKMPYDSLASRFVNNTSVPGIITIHTTPRFGVLDEANDPINVSMRNIYSFVRHANSGSTNYEAPDLMLYLMAMDSCFSFLEMLKRVYGTILTYSATNRYFPVGCVHAQGFNFHNLQRNIADFRAYINSLAVKVGSMCIPASMSYMARHMWMYSGMYYDTPNNEKAQVYMYVPEAFYRFTQDSDGAGALCLVDFDRTKYSSDFVYPDSDEVNGWTFEDIVEFGNAFIDPILADEDMNIMSGDILKAFGAENVYMVSAIPENYTVLPVYSQEVLEQIHNTTLNGRSIQPNYPWSTLPDITRNNSIIQSPDKTYLLNIPHASFVFPLSQSTNFDWDAQFSNLDQSSFTRVFNSMNSGKRLLDFESGPVSPAQAMVASRLTALLNDGAKIFTKEFPEEDSVAAKYHGANEDLALVWIHTTYSSCGSETAGFMKVWYWANVGYNAENDWALIQSEDIYSGMLLFTPWDDSEDDSEDVRAAFEFSLQRKAMLSVFNMHPFIQDCLCGADLDDTAIPATWHAYNPTWPQGDVNYYTVIDNADLTQMHEVALLSEFNVTQYGRRAQ